MHKHIVCLSLSGELRFMWVAGALGGQPTKMIAIPNFGKCQKALKLERTPFCLTPSFPPLSADKN